MAEMETTERVRNKVGSVIMAIVAGLYAVREWQRSLCWHGPPPHPATVFDGSGRVPAVPL